LYNKGILNNEVLNARSKETNSGKALRILLQEIGEKAFTQWIFGILDSLQQAEVLRPALHGVGIRPTSFSRSWLVYCSLSCQEDRRGWLLLSLREAECEGCTSQGWQPSEQLADELGAYLSELSQSGAQAERLLRDLWCASQGVGILHQALSAFQEVGRSALDEGQSTQPIIQVRRLTPTECARLQAFPDDHLSQVRINGKPPTDGPMYRALGNSMCVNVMAFIGQRIQLANGRQLNQEAA
jgi:DNA (cytosine-5)-methyltransferase 1